MCFVTARLDVLQGLKDRSLGEKVVLDVAQAQSKVVQMFQDLLQSQLSQFTAATAKTAQNTHHIYLTLGGLQRIIWTFSGLLFIIRIIEKHLIMCHYELYLNL